MGSIVVFGAVVCEASYTLLSKKIDTSLHSGTLIGLAPWFALLVFAPLAIYDMNKSQWTAPSWSNWIALIWCGFGTSVLGTVIGYRAVRRAAGSSVSSAIGTMPVSALVLSCILLGESFEFVHRIEWPEFDLDAGEADDRNATSLPHSWRRRRSTSTL